MTVKVRTEENGGQHQPPIIAFELFDRQLTQRSFVCTLSLFNSSDGDESFEVSPDLKPTFHPGLSVVAAERWWIPGRGVHSSLNDLIHLLVRSGEILFMEELNMKIYDLMRQAGLAVEYDRGFACAVGTDEQWEAFEKAIFPPSVATITKILYVAIHTNHTNNLLIFVKTVGRFGVKVQRQLISDNMSVDGKRGYQYHQLILEGTKAGITEAIKELGPLKILQVRMSS